MQASPFIMQLENLCFDYRGRGDMFFEFCPIRHEEWKIEPNKDYRLKYRMVVFEGKLTADEAESYWKSFAETLKIVKE